jgi:hypothetical protein
MAPGGHNGTFRGNNLAFVAGTGALELWRDREFDASLKTSIGIVWSWMEGLVADLGARRVQPKGRGLISGLAFADQEAAGRVAAEAFRRNLIIETSGPHSEVIKLLPPLTIEHDVLDEGLKRLQAAIQTAVEHVSGRPHERAGAGRPQGFRRWANERDHLFQPPVSSILQRKVRPAAALGGICAQFADIGALCVRYRSRPDRWPWPRHASCWLH